MNKEYTYIDGKAIIKDENGNQRPIEYYDNLDEVLVQENIIEIMENRITYLEKESKEYKKYNKKHYFPITFLISAIMITVGVPVLFYLFEHTMVSTTIYTIFSALFLPLAGLMEFSMYRQHKDNLKKENGINSELEFLKKQIIEEREHLIELKQEKKESEENKEFRVVQVDDLERLKAVKSWLHLYYDLGYDVEKYYGYYKKGKLDTKLSKHYNEKGIEVAKKYLEEKGPTLVKKKKNTNSNKKR